MPFDMYSDVIVTRDVSQHGIVPAMSGRSLNDTPRVPSNMPECPPAPLEAVERDLVQKALANARNNKSLAKLLGVPRGQFYSLLRRQGLTDARR